MNSVASVWRVVYFFICLIILFASGKLIMVVCRRTKGLIKPDLMKRIIIRWGLQFALALTSVIDRFFLRQAIAFRTLSPVQYSRPFVLFRVFTCFV